LAPGSSSIKRTATSESQVQTSTTVAVKARVTKTRVALPNWEPVAIPKKAEKKSTPVIPETGEKPTEAASVFGWSSAILIDLAIQDARDHPD
jgi:hypothetical protein